jgi:restriction system protein
MRFGGSAEVSVTHNTTASGAIVLGGLVAAGTAHVVLEDLPSILMQAVVITGEKNEEGRLIQAVALPWFDIINLIKNDPAIAFQIDSRKWEEIVAGAYHRFGFKVTLTPRSGDLGRDVIAEKAGWGCVRFIDQVKAYKPGHLVTAEEVRALGHVLQADQNATKGFVTTTSDFAPKIVEDKFIKPFLPYRIELVNGVRLLQHLVELAKSGTS